MKQAPAWLVGIAYLPFGLFTGFYMVAMPFLLTSRGMPLDRVGAITSIVLIPTFSSFLLTPIADCGFSRRTWALLTGACAALCLTAAVMKLDDVVAGRAALFTTLLVAGMLCAQMYSSIMGGMTPNLVREEDTGSVSAWLNVANLGGIGIGGQMAILLITHLPRVAGAWVEGAVVYAPALLLLVIGNEPRVPRRVREAMRGLFRDLWAVSRTRAALVGLLIFVTPSATFAACNLFSGLGQDFHASDATTQWLTGTGSSILCSAGSFAGGWLSNRMDRRKLFVGTGVVSAAATLAMAFGPRTAATFCPGVGCYYLLAGINFAACSAAAFDIMGANNPLSATQYALLMASTNVAITTVTASDSRGYAHFGARGLLVTDALFPLITGTVMLAVLSLWGGSGKRDEALPLVPAKSL